MNKMQCRDSDEISIEYKRINNGIGMNSFHSHHSYEILFIINGSLIILFNDGYYELHAGDIALFSPNESHKSLGNNLREWVCLNFSEEYLKQYFSADASKILVSTFKNRIIHPNANQFTDLCKMFHILYNNYKNGDDMLFMDISNLLMNISRMNQPIPKKNPVNKKLLDMVHYISENYAYDISIENIADNCHLSKAWTCSLFKNYFDTTPMKFLNNIRILHACDILLTTDMNITEVAMNCGFSSASHFGRIFKLTTGQTPSEFRKSKK